MKVKMVNNMEHSIKILSSEMFHGTLLCIELFISNFYFVAINKKINKTGIDSKN